MASDRDKEFLKRLLGTFKVEAEEHIKEISAGLLELEKCNDLEQQNALIEKTFREAHSLKGAARAVNLVEIEAICQHMESVFSSLKRREIIPSAEIFDLLQETLDFLEETIPELGTGKNREDKSLQRQLISRLERVLHGETSKTIPPVVLTQETDHDADNSQKNSEENPPLLPAEATAGAEHKRSAPLSAKTVAQTRQSIAAQIPDTVRVSTARLSSVLLQSEEMLSAKLAASQRIIDMRVAGAAFITWRKEWSRISPQVQKLRQISSKGKGDGRSEVERDLLRLIEFFDWNSEFIKSFEANYRAGVKSAEQDSRSLGTMVNTLLSDVKKVLMFPFSSLLEILPKLVRDLGRESGKEIELVVTGEEIEVDRRILEEMKDPLIHLIRNCIDHGIETPAERKAKGKTSSGTIRVAILPRDDKVELSICDDGKGISCGSIRSALSRGSILSSERINELSEPEIMAQIFQSGVSTSPIITELSGRGLGLAIVREKVEKLGGTVSVTSNPDIGATFRIILPLTVATFRGLLIRLNDRLFVLPAMHVNRVLRLPASEIKPVENRETIRLNEEALSLARLSDLLELSRPTTDSGTAAPLPIVIISNADTRIALLVDEIIGEQEVLLKGLGRQLSRVRNVAGATVLGNGRVAPILNVTDLIKSAVKYSTASRWATAAHDDTAIEQSRSILVVEDSITTRTLIKNILESSGYLVTTAVDGVDAMTSLRSGSFDLVVSDVEMPRMNGFELTAKIRSDKALSDLPVILVTALASREDRERGIDAGANAYIVKSSFDQSNLLDVMKKLV